MRPCCARLGFHGPRNSTAVLTSRATRSMARGSHRAAAWCLSRPTWRRRIGCARRSCLPSVRAHAGSRLRRWRGSSRAQRVLPANSRRSAAWMGCRARGACSMVKMWRLQRSGLRRTCARSLRSGCRLISACAGRISRSLSNSRGLRPTRRSCSTTSEIRRSSRGGRIPSAPSGSGSSRASPRARTSRSSGRRCSRTPVARSASTKRARGSSGASRVSARRA